MSSPTIKKSAKSRKLIDINYKIDEAGWIIAAITIAVVSLILHSNIITFVGPQIIQALESNGQASDIFVQYKWFFLCLGTVTLLALLLYKMFVNEYVVKESPANVPIALFGILVALSTAVCDYPVIATAGVIDMLMGASKFIILILLCWALINVKVHRTTEKLLFISLSLVVLVELIVTVGAFYGIQWHALPGLSTVFFPDLNANGMVARGMIVSTLNNPNYASGLMGALAAAFFTVAMLMEDRWHTALAALLGILSAVIMLTQTSVSGFVAFLTGLIITIMFLVIKREKSVFHYATLAGVLIIILTSGYILNLHNPAVNLNTLGFVKSAASYVTRPSSPTSVPVSDMPSAPAVTDSKFDIGKKVKGGIDSFRIYIAANTWNLIKARPLLGYGMDSIAYYYPIMSRDSIDHFGPDEFLTKPHNMYLQIAFGAGIPALLCFLWLITAYAWTTLRYIYSNFKETRIIPPYPAAIFIFVVAFCVQGLVNDLSLAPGMMLFALMGIGFGLIPSETPDLKSAAKVK